jgi:hypothetical protein
MWYYLNADNLEPSTSSLVEGEESLQICSSETLPYVLANWMNMQGASCLHDNETEYFPGSQYGMTCEPSAAKNGGVKQMSCVPDSPAKTLAPPEQTIMSMVSNVDWRETKAVFGMKCHELSKKFNLRISDWKIHRTYALEGLSPSSKLLMHWGMTRQGECLEVECSAQITTDRECGLSPKLPTPTKHNSKEGAYPAEFTRNTPTLAAQIGGKVNPDWNEWRMGWPTRWTDLKPLGMDKMQEWLRLHGKH